MNSNCQLLQLLLSGKVFRKGWKVNPNRYETPTTDPSLILLTQRPSLPTKRPTDLQTTVNLTEVWRHKDDIKMT